MASLLDFVTSDANIAHEEISIALIGPDEERRALAADVLGRYPGADVKEYSRYPDDLYQLPKLIDQHYDIVIVDLDSNSDDALRVVQGVCLGGIETVMVYSSQDDLGLLVRCMHAGAREFIPVPFDFDVVEEALVRASVRRSRDASDSVREGRVLLFMGAKGGVGVTSIACNYAAAMAQDLSQKTLLIDLDLPLGDVGVNLGIAPEFSTISALQETDRLDGAFLSKLVVKHKSGLHVLAAPGRFAQFQPTTEAIERLLAVAIKSFDNVVVDMGTHLDLLSTTLHHEAAKIYLVTQPGIAELRNAHRLITQAFEDDKSKLEIVLNRFQSRTIGLSEEQITEALTQPVKWKIPNDHQLVRKMQAEGSPLFLSQNPMARSIREMAQAASGKLDAKGAEEEKGSSFSISSLLRKKKNNSSEQQFGRVRYAADSASS